MRTVLLAFFLATLALPPTKADDLVFPGKPPQFEDYSYLVVGAAWRFHAGQAPIIFVCWENPTTENQRARDWVKDQITKTWQKHTALEFSGWQRCGEKNAGIRVLFADVGPHVKRFGRHLDGVWSGMVLNDLFEKWEPTCKKEREHCVRVIAAHEFGHALGFAHEQNRPDTPGECRVRHGQGQLKENALTPYDPKSVMNYCNLEWNNKGELSELDIRGAQKIYGQPRQR